MQIPPGKKRREVLQPSLLPVPDYGGPGKATPRDHYCFSYGVRDGAGNAVINNVTNIIITLLHLSLTVRHI